MAVHATEALHQPILDSIRRYRMGCRQLFGILGCAMAAGASIIDNKSLSLKPNTSAAQLLLRQVFGLAEDDQAKVLVYPARRWFLQQLCPSCLSFVWDSARRQVVTRWRARDPEFTKAQRGWLILQGARGVGEFRHTGIEMPQATARPKLLKREVKLKWDRVISDVTLYLESFDPGRWWTWSKILDGTWSAGTVTLNERDGKLRLTVSYDQPVDDAKLDPERTLTVVVANDNLILSGPSGETVSIGLANAIGRLKQLRAQSELWDRRKRCAGNPKRPWGDKKSWRQTVKHLNGITLNRRRFQEDCNHAWSRRVASNAIRWRCGNIVFTVPDSAKLMNEPWQWADFATKIAYKISDRGGVLTTL